MTYEKVYTCDCCGGTICEYVRVGMNEITYESYLGFGWKGDHVLVNNPSGYELCEKCFAHYRVCCDEFSRALSEIRTHGKPIIMGQEEKQERGLFKRFIDFIAKC